MRDWLRIGISDFSSGSGDNDMYPCNSYLNREYIRWARRRKQCLISIGAFGRQKEETRKLLIDSSLSQPAVNIPNIQDPEVSSYPRLPLLNPFPPFTDPRSRRRLDL